jgi:hypothetical protein
VEQHRGVPRLELTHDVLADPVRRSRERRQEQEARERQWADERQQREELRQTQKRLAVVRALLAVAIVALAAAIALAAIAWRDSKRAQASTRLAQVSTARAQKAESDLKANYASLNAARQQDLKDLQDAIVARANADAALRRARRDEVNLAGMSRERAAAERQTRVVLLEVARATLNPEHGTLVSYGEAIQSVGGWLRDHPKDAQMVNVKVWLYITRGDAYRESLEQYSNAEADYSSAERAAESIQGRTKDGPYDLAVCNERFGNLWRDRAKTEKDPNAVSRDLQQALGFHSWSLAQFRRIEAEDHTAPHVQSLAIEEHNLGLDCLTLKRFGQARAYYQAELKDYEKAAKLGPGDEATRRVARAYAGLWSVDDRAGNHLSAREDLDREIQLLKPLADGKIATPRDRHLVADALGERSWQDVLAGEFQGAILDAQQGLSYDPTETWIRTNEGHGYLFSGKREQAETIYLMYLKAAVYPSDPNSKNFCQAVLDDFSTFEKLRPPGMDLTKIGPIRSLLQQQPACQRTAELKSVAAPQQH